MIGTMTLMMAILVDISIDNHSWFSPTALAGIRPLTECQKCKICCCVTTTVTMHVNVTKSGHAIVLFVILVTRLQRGLLCNRGSILGRSNRFFIYLKRPGRQIFPLKTPPLLFRYSSGRSAAAVRSDQTETSRTSNRSPSNKDGWKHT